jgi:hypothetical protein
MSCWIYFPPRFAPATRRGERIRLRRTASHVFVRFLRINCILVKECLEPADIREAVQYFLARVRIRIKLRKLQTLMYWQKAHIIIPLKHGIQLG